ncbi:MAG: MerR family transcriptional regulator, partial [Acidimicrobiales bacterium]
MAEERPGSSLSRGELARRARLTPKALRVYERVGLLSPVGIEETNGYRRYGADQVRTGQLIGLLRGADLSLADIALVLDDLARDAKAAVTRLDQLLAQINRRHADRLLVIRHVQATLREGDDPM